ncbi:aminotransferase class I/II-fold pyridoxal phosphate-dependent enzyme [Kineococcus aurantiacus]|uniref:dTDP-4-amino-4,6-dideoxygalactose transaminase n=1 Tax=Kineococcus aurantiacus TaxID=37633 RepID=A0A7Y9J2T6_9ACTN|nr:dTDP-4-amino-4,6-dideoxygalactose transaminase [Kineococcus aurantiacus]
MTYHPSPIIFGQPWFDHEEEELLVQTLRSGWIGQGPLVQRFEEELAQYLGSPHVVATSSCTASLHLALVAMGVGPGDEVITTPFTFVATVNAIEHAGATPVLVDIDRDTFSISAESIEGALTSRTRAVVPVHFAGRAAGLSEIYRLAEEHDLVVVEDAAHALGAVHDGARVGNAQNPRSLTCFSFYPNKNLATAEGGAISLADPETAQRLKSLRLHGLDGDAWARYRTRTFQPTLATYPGFKYNFTDLQASIALGQLHKLEGFLAGREFLADCYDELISDLPGVRIVDRGRPTMNHRHALHLYQVIIEGPTGRRDQVLDELRGQNIGAAVHYVGVNQHPYYQEKLPGDFPNSDWATDALLTLPLHLHMSRRSVERVASGLISALERTRT